MKQKNAVLIVSDYFYPHWTGLAKSLYYGIEAIDSIIDCTVLTVRHDRSLAKEEIVSHTKVYRADPLVTFSRAKYSLQLLVAFISLAKKQDVILINSPCTNVLPLAVLTKVLRKKLLLFHQGDLLLPIGIVNRIIEKIFDASTYLACVLADKVSTYSEDYATHSRILRPFLKKCIPVQFPIPLKYKKAEIQRKQRAEIRFGFAGRFVEEKGFDILFKAIPEIIKHTPTARFYYAGETHMSYENFFEDKKELYEKVKEHITLVGLLKDKDLLKFYQSLDFIIVPSRSDCFNLVQAEAMLCGVPSIASDIPGLRYLVKETGFGRLFAVGDSDDLARQSKIIVEKRKELMVLYSNVKKVLNNEVTVKKLITFITE